MTTNFPDPRKNSRAAYSQSIAEIIKAVDCPKGFACVESEFRHLCRAMDVGRETYLACIEEHPENCPFSVFLAASWHCKCPMRIFIAKHLSRL
jgi:hypothetical protein